MNNLSIYDTLNQFKEQWERVPQMRFMQVISNFQHHYQKDGFFLENDRFLEMLTAYIDELKGEK